MALSARDADALRKLRKRLTGGVSDLLASAAPLLPTPCLRAAAGVIATAGPHTPVLGRQVRANLSRLGLDGESAARGYFQQLGRHFADALLIMREGRHTRPNQLAPRLVRRAAWRFGVEPSVHAWADQLAGRGGILVAPHVCGYLLFLATLSATLPLTIYLRHSKNPRHQASKARWATGAGVDWVSEPRDASGTLGRLAPLADAIRRGRVVFITPDLPQKSDDGSPARFADRTIYLPAGFAVLAQRTGCPIARLDARLAGEVLQLGVVDDFNPPAGDRRAAIGAAVDWFASGLEQFLRTSPALWYFWGDKRWTRVFADDPRYVAEPQA